MLKTLFVAVDKSLDWICLYPVVYDALGRDPLKFSDYVHTKNP